MAFLHSFFIVTLVISLGVAASIFIKRPHTLELTTLNNKDYRYCPQALELHNAKANAILDIDYLDGLCKNAAGLIRLKVSGNFDSIGDTFFSKLPRLEDFQANNMNNLSKLSMTTWNIKLLDVSRNKLDYVSMELMGDILHLNLSHNELLEDNLTMTSTRPALSLKLLTLDLSYNKFTKIDTIYPFWNLRKFILNDNHIAFIKPGILQKYPNLVTLNLARNRIYDLPNGMFTGLIHLVTLDLSHNYLKEAKIKIINSLRSLEFLDMLGNKIKEFDYDELDHHLEVLRINEENVFIHGKRIAQPKSNTTTVKPVTTTEETNLVVTVPE